MNNIKEYSIYPGQIKVDNEVFFGLDYKITDLFNQIAEENQKKGKEIERLTNVINELEKEINNQLNMTRKFDKYNEGYFNATLNYYNKLKELKEGKGDKQ